MQADETALFLSLRPRYAELLLSGRKSVELRRVRPAVPKGATALLYASSPAMTLVGRAEVREIHVGSLEDIWRAHGPQTGINRAEYDSYFAGTENAVAIVLSNIHRLDSPRPLSDLRHRLAGFRPPQSYRYLDHSQVSALI
jgi:predicted transcriptional regulator